MLWTLCETMAVNQSEVIVWVVCPAGGCCWVVVNGDERIVESYKKKKNYKNLWQFSEVVLPSSFTWLKRQMMMMSRCCWRLLNQVLLKNFLNNSVQRLDEMWVVNRYLSRVSSCQVDQSVFRVNNWCNDDRDDDLRKLFLLLLSFFVATKG